MASAWSRAKPVEPTLSGKLVAEADYRKGDAGKPAVILLHGFLQTHALKHVGREIDAWVKWLKAHNRVQILPGASHFMDGVHEFDLVDAVLTELKAS